MKKLSVIAAAVLLSGFLIAPVFAGPNDNSAGTQKNEKSSQYAPKKTGLSKRNKAKIEAQQMKAKRNAEAANSTQTQK